MNTTANPSVGSRRPIPLLRRALVLLVPSALAFGFRGNIVEWLQYREWVNGEFQATALYFLIFLLSLAGTIVGGIQIMRALIALAAPAFHALAAGATLVLRLLWVSIAALLGAIDSGLISPLARGGRYVAARLASVVLAFGRIVAVAIYTLGTATVWMARKMGKGALLLACLLLFLGRTMLVPVLLLGRGLMWVLLVLGDQLIGVLRRLWLLIMLCTVYLGRALLVLGRGLKGGLRHLAGLISVCLSYLWRGFAFVLRCLWLGVSVPYRYVGRYLAWALRYVGAALRLTVLLLGRTLRWWAIMLLVPSALALGFHAQIVEWAQHRELMNGEFQATVLTVEIVVLSLPGTIVGGFFAFLPVGRALRSMLLALGRGLMRGLRFPALLGAICLSYLGRGLAFVLRFLWRVVSDSCAYAARCVVLALRSLGRGLRFLLLPLGRTLIWTLLVLGRGLRGGVGHLVRLIFVCVSYLWRALVFGLRCLWLGVSVPCRYAGRGLVRALKHLGRTLRLTVLLFGRTLRSALLVLGRGLTSGLRHLAHGVQRLAWLITIWWSYPRRAVAFALRCLRLWVWVPCLDAGRRVACALQYLRLRVASLYAYVAGLLRLAARTVWLNIGLALGRLGRALRLVFGHVGRAAELAVARAARVVDLAGRWIGSIAATAFRSLHRGLAFVFMAVSSPLVAAARTASRLVVTLLRTIRDDVQAFLAYAITRPFVFAWRTGAELIGASRRIVRYWLRVVAGACGDVLGQTRRLTTDLIGTVYGALTDLLGTAAAWLRGTSRRLRRELAILWLEATFNLRMTWRGIAPELAAVARDTWWVLRSAATYALAVFAFPWWCAIWIAVRLIQLFPALLGGGRRVAARSTRLFVAAGFAAVVGVVAIAPVQRSVGAVGCESAEKMLGLGVDVGAASSASFVDSLVQGVQDGSWGLWGLLSRETRRSLCLPPGALILAYSPEKESLFRDLVASFNDARPADLPPVLAVKLETADMLESAVDGKLGAISPDSDLWLAQLDGVWQQRNPQAAPLVGSITRYARSPLVIAMRESDARKMGYPATPLGWDDLMKRSSQDVGFRWSHPAATTASGLLATTAVFYAGAGKLTGLTGPDLASATTIEYVKAVEGSVVRYGGESEDRMVARLLNDASYPLDAFVAQEQMVVHFNRQSQGAKLVAVYPREGTFSMDHPLALLEGPRTTAEQRRVFDQFAEYITQPEQQRLVLREGYRPASFPRGTEQDSPIKPEYNVDPDQPKTLLSVPSRETLTLIREVWQLTKRSANIYLVVDVSGSMRGEKMEAARQALLSFVDQIKSEREQVALVAFSKEVREVEPLRLLADNRDALKASVDGLRPGGDTALYDAVLFALDRLQRRRDPERINAIVVMSDGQDTSSKIKLEQIVARARSADPPVLIFAVAYGDDAELSVLRQIAEGTDGQAFTSYPATIRRLYELVAKFF